MGAETCDDGILDDDEGCEPDCSKPLFGWTCVKVGFKSVCNAICGDAMKAGKEGCDDGNLVDWDGCFGNCTEAPGWSCAEDVFGKSICVPNCGNGRRDPKDGETCDDSNTNSGDGCSGCTVDNGWECHGGNETFPDTCCQ